MKILIIMLNVGFVKNAGEEGEMKVKSHNYITGKYRESAHQEYNLNLSLSENSYCCVSYFVNSVNRIFEEIGKFCFKMNVTLKRIE